MYTVQVRQIAVDPWEFKVRLNEEDEMVGEYVVTMTEEEYEQYGADADPPDIVSATFKFLLEHEDPEQISAEFSLSEVATHWPEYADQVADYL